MATPSTPNSARTASRADRIDSWGMVQLSEEEAGGVVPPFAPDGFDPDEPESAPPEDVDPDEPASDPPDEPVSDEAFFL